MDKLSGKLTVQFDEPFWVGIFERVEEGKLSVAKVTFGTELKDYEIYEFILRHDYSLQFSPVVATAVNKTIRNPKRMQRDVKKQLRDIWIGIKSQQEHNKRERKVKSQKKKLAEDKRMFELKQQKKKEKHRGT